MQRDPTYYPLYQKQKQYYLNRPDILAQKDTEKGWLGHVDNRAKRWIAKLILSHAWEVLRRSKGLPVNPHRNYIAIPTVKKDE